MKVRPDDRSESYAMLVLCERAYLNPARKRSTGQVSTRRALRDWACAELLLVLRGNTSFIDMASVLDYHFEAWGPASTTPVGYPLLGNAGKSSRRNNFSLC